MFLHGYLSDKKAFTLQRRFFENFYDTYAFDFTGFGLNSSMRYAYNLTDYALETLEFIDKNNLKNPFVIAHSFGGRVAIKIAGGLEKNAFSKIVLTGSAGLKKRRTPVRLIKKGYYNIVKNFLSPNKRLKFFSSDYQKLSPVMRESFKLIVNENLESLAKEITAKTLIINGENDRETPFYTAKKFNRLIKNSYLYKIKNAGHFSFLEKPDEFNRITLSFLTDNFSYN